MPQMKPMYWTILFSITSTQMIIMMCFIYFLFYTSNYIIFNNKYNNFNMSTWNWKKWW
uniref:ATP synthase subunit 8 n=1 Tax=Pristomyrmex punctatus TaxID=507543 RepID=E5RPZ7_9HYME|nr:ATP synthase F0 subunit 8 [Pristomyrmex punctatus]BAJ53350.1 ATP synthase subunit 8 [Pristomyrmex punctatus]BAJ53363.1 ATP synthase subunit 8 [Pristomyrmex punctatus]